MSKSKQKKLEKIKKRKIWPFVVMIVVSIFLFAGVSFVLLASGFLNLVIPKAQNAYQMVQGVQKGYLDCHGTGEDFSKVCDNIYNFTSDIQSICLLDEQNQLLEQYGDEKPDFTNMKLLEDVVELTEDELGQKDALWTDMKILRTRENALSIAGDEAFLVYCWYVHPLPDSTQKLCVKVRICVYENELMNIVISIILFSVLMILLMAWNIIMIVRVAKERRREKDILYTSTITGGTNLQYFKDRAEVLLKANQRKQFHYAMISIRVSKYQNFCSCYGMEEGEELLESLFVEMKKQLQKKEIAAHAARADFALLLKCEETDNLTDRLEHILEALKKVRPDQKLNFGVGVYWVPKKHGDIGTLYNYAEVVHDVIPEDMEDHIKCFDESLLEQQRWVRRVEDDMERALSDGEFKVYLQPKYSTKEEKISGAEALVRWIHMTEGFIPPDRFIPIFEKNGFILQLDDYMISECAKLQAKWLAEGKKIVPISVNVSRAHFTRYDLAEHICALADAYNVPHNMIELELTESAFFDDREILINTVKKLKDYGFAVSMDDFGAGYSSLNSLKELPIDVLKLDAEFFRGEDNEGRGDLIVGETITLAKKLDMRIVAEGIETREQVESLAQKDCDLIQGYYFSKPMPVGEFEKAAFE